MPPCPPEVGVWVTGGTGVLVGGGVLTAAALPRGAGVDVAVWVAVGMHVAYEHLVEMGAAWTEVGCNRKLPPPTSPNAVNASNMTVYFCRKTVCNAKRLCFIRFFLVQVSLTTVPIHRGEGRFLRKDTQCNIDRIEYDETR